MIQVTRAPLLFATDLDGTLLPNGNEKAEDGCLERSWALLEALRASGSPIVYSSGRHLALARQAQRTFRLALPDHWVCNVGSEIYDLHGAPDLVWRERLGPAFDRVEMQARLSDISHLLPQEAAKQGLHKLSFYYPGAIPDELLERIAARLRELRDDLRLIHSVEESSGRGLLDVVPQRAGKAPALAYLREHYSLGRDEVFFSGDSGNDFDALMSGVCATLVGNAPPPVRTAAERLRAETKGAECFFAERYYGDGILQGLAHFGLIEYGD